MGSLENYLDERLARGRAYFSRQEALSALGGGASALQAAAGRLIRKQRLASPRRGFYLILRPEDRSLGAPDPVRWIGPLMAYLRVDYRISLLRAAAHHGASHQAAMAFQVVAPRQLRPILIGRHRLQFVFQAPGKFARVNRPDWLVHIKSEAGYARAAGVELTLLDCARYVEHAGGVQGLAQIAHDLGDRARPAVLATAADAYENAAVRRLGYLLELAVCKRQSEALLPLARRAKSFKPLNPAVKPLSGLGAECVKEARWQLVLNEPVEIEF